MELIFLTEKHRDDYERLNISYSTTEVITVVIVNNVCEVAGVANRVKGRREPSRQWAGRRPKDSERLFQAVNGC